MGWVELAQNPGILGIPSALLAAWGRPFDQVGHGRLEEEGAHEVGVWATPQGGSQRFLALIGLSRCGHQVLPVE